MDIDIHRTDADDQPTVDHVHLCSPICVDHAPMLRLGGYRHDGSAIIGIPHDYLD